MCCFFAAGVQYITLNLTNIQDFIFLKVSFFRLMTYNSTFGTLFEGLIHVMQVRTILNI